MSENRLHPLAVLKGCVEHDDPARHFGSTGSLGHWIRTAQALDLIDGKEQPTARGREIHRKWLADLADTRQVFWDRRVVEAASKDITTLTAAN